MAEPLPEPDVNDEFAQLWVDEGIVVLSALHGRMLAAFSRALIREPGWTRSMVLAIAEAYIDSGFLSTEEEEE